MTALGLAFKLSYCVANHEDRNVHMQKDPLGENKANNDTEAGVDSKAERDGECDWGCDERARRRRKREERNQERKNMLARELLRTQLFGRTQKFSLPLIFVDYPYQLLQALVHKSRATGGGADRMGSSSTALTGSFPSAPLHTHNVQDNNNIPGRACTGAGVLPLGREGGVGDCDGSASSGLAVADVLVKERDSEVRALKRMASNLLLSLSLYICVNIVPLLYHRLSRQWQTELKNQRQEKTRVARRRMRREGDGGLNYAEYDMGTEGTRLSLQSRLTAQMHACLTAVSVRRRACLAYSSHCMSFLTNELISCSSHAGGLVSSLFHSRTSSSPSLPLSAASSGPAHDTGSEGAYIEHKFRKALFLRSVALAIQQEMLASAKVCRERMLRKKGVLVRRALYGYSVDSIHSSSSAKLGLIDVSVSLQVLVRLDGSLVLPHGVSKRGMLNGYTCSDVVL